MIVPDLPIRFKQQFVVLFRCQPAHVKDHGCVFVGAPFSSKRFIAGKRIEDIHSGSSSQSGHVDEPRFGVLVTQLIGRGHVANRFIVYPS